MFNMKIFRWFYNNAFFVITLFLLAFIPLYPKLPVLDVNHTWVYVRIEDFIVAFVFLLWLVLMLCKKITFKTPLTMPILLFWIIGAISTLHGVLLIFPTISNVFPNVAFLNFLRRIEYISLFFIAYSGIKDKRFISYVVITLAVTLFLIVGYGFGQKYFGFPAFLTMNEEFAKGIPIRLSSLSRVPSTFGGHYDLAAYLVLMIPLLASMIFGFRNLFIKGFLLVTVSLGFVLLFMTVSRISLFVLLISLVLMLFLQKKRLIIISVFLITLVLLSFSQSLLQRYGNTLKEVNVLVDAQTGNVIGKVKMVQAKYFDNKVIKKKYILSENQIDSIKYNVIEDDNKASDSAENLSWVVPSMAALVVDTGMPTGEDLPEGTGYINLPLTPITKRLGQFFYQKEDKKGIKDSGDIVVVFGEVLIKKAIAYDLSFTTRFQGEWPHAIEAFKRNVLLGSGYSSVSLAVDNNYLRILGEVGLLGFLSFFSLFLISGIYIKKIWSDVDSSLVKSFILGLAAGFFGLALNAAFIDVFEASKIAFVLWLLVGIIIGTLHLYQKKEIDIFEEFKKTITSTYAVIIYLFVTVAVTFSAITNYFFVGDDFTWFKWIADCKNNIVGSQQCQSIVTTIFHYFTESNGFFYRPGTKVYFLLMYSGFWLNQVVYHMVSIFLHFVVTMLIFLISKKILKNFLLSAGAAFLFLILSGYSEAVFWISSTGFLFNAVFSLLSLYFYTIWEEKKKNIYFVLSLASIVFGLMFHELGVVTPLFIILYAIVIEEKLTLSGLFKKSSYLVFLSPIIPYLGLRFLAQSHWFNGDYSYNLLKLPYNIVGNIIGYLLLALFGSASLPFYQGLRNFSKGHMIFAVFASIIVILAITMIYRMIIRKMVKEERKILIFGSMFFIISLLPFLGLGNITSRYSYLSSVGFIILFVFFLKKLYNYLSINGRSIAIATIVIVVSIFSLFQLIQLQKINRDWYDAGEKSKNFLVSFNSFYNDYWAKQHMQFYFVNIPIRIGDAWVFPVGLKDALWFVLGNDNIGLHQMSSVNQALNAISGSPYEKVFEFDDSGRVIERKKYLPNTISEKN